MQESFDLPPDQWQTLRRLLDDALERPPEGRDTWLAELGDEYAPLKARLKALLAHAAPGRTLPLDTLPKIETAQFIALRQRELPGSTVGPYRLLRTLGEGGMGTVWLAERTDLLQHRQVALKLPRAVVGRAGLEQRLARERDILAALDHPHIARLYDAGVTADGQPWFAMEYVEGERIDAYCRRHALDLRARLRLFVQVIGAVAHAHSRLIVHRDLKPANMLVTEAGEVRLLDFGIARLLDDGRAGETELTQLGGRALTPEYAAPEQILGQPIGTGADIYALGIVLFELLTGTRPYRLRRESRAALEEAIAQAQVRRPSDVAADRGIARQLRGDLDTIVLKALKPESAQRYGTAAAFADDIGRHLARQPVQARPDSTWYRAGRFMVRNKAPVAGAAAGFAALAIAAGVTSWQAQVARDEQRRAEQVKALIASIFQDVNPAQRTGAAFTALDLLAQARTRVERATGLDPASRTELLLVLAESYWGLDESSQAAQLAEAALAAGQPVHAPAHPQMLRIELVLANARHALGEHARARSLVGHVAQVLEEQGRTASDAPLYVKAQAMAATFELNEGRHASPVAFEAASKAVRAADLAGLDDAAAVFAHQVLSSVHRWRSEAVPARDQARLAYEKALSLYGSDGRHARTLEVQNEYGRALARAGELGDAVRIMQSGAEAAPAVFGAQHVMVQHFLGTLGSLQVDYGLLAEGLRSLQQASGTDLRDVKVSATYEASRQIALARAHLASAQPAAALPRYERAIDLLASVRPRGVLHWQADQERALATALSGAPDRAAALLEPLAQEQQPDGSLQGALRHLATARRLTGDAAGARQSIDAALRLLEQLDAQPHPPTAHRLALADGWREAGHIALLQGELHSAERRFHAAIGRMRALQARATPALADAQTGLARALLMAGRASEARQHADAAVEFWRGFDADNRGAGAAAFWQARSLAALGLQTEADAAFARAAQLLADSPLPGDQALARQARAG